MNMNFTNINIMLVLFCATHTLLNWYHTAAIVLMWLALDFSISTTLMCLLVCWVLTYFHIFFANIDNLYNILAIYYHLCCKISVSLNIKNFKKKQSIERLKHRRLKTKSHRTTNQKQKVALVLFRYLNTQILFKF